MIDKTDSNSPSMIIIDTTNYRQDDGDDDGDVFAYSTYIDL